MGNASAGKRGTPCGWQPLLRGTRRKLRRLEAFEAVKEMQTEGVGQGLPPLVLAEIVEEAEER